MSAGPFLYDDGPAPLHTGTPRRRTGLLLWVFGGTVVLAVLMVVLMSVIKGSAEDQAREVAGVFLAALDQGDTETAHQLLCDQERVRVGADEVSGEYLGAEPGRVVGVEEAEVDGSAVAQVRVQWDDGSATQWVVVSENGPRLCGTGPAD
jgi:hypothetical protein